MLGVLLAALAAANVVVGQEVVPIPPVGPVQAYDPPPIAPAPVYYPQPGQGLGPAALARFAQWTGRVVGSADDAADARNARWEDARFIAWQAYAQGEYVGHARIAHVPEYRLRVDDQLDMIYRLTRDETRTPYRLNVGDEVHVESFTDPDLNRDLMIQPDGTITLRLLGQVHATGRTVTQLRDGLDELYKKYYKVPSITVTPLKVNTKLDDLRNGRSPLRPRRRAEPNVRVTPDGTISLPAIGYVHAQGLTLDELQQEINERYRETIEGMEIIPVLDCTRRASSTCWARCTPGPLRDDRPDHRAAGHRHGRQLERGRNICADRRLPPRRRLAADGHDDRSRRRAARQASPARTAKSGSTTPT